jgi:non-ribosomal peptide synthetase component E (peptide arylation enzyme)
MRDLPVVRSWLDADRSARYRAEGLWGDATIVELFDRQAQLRPDKLAVADAEVRWTYAELQDRSLRLARLLVDLGVRRGEAVAAQVPSSALLPLMHLATNRIGALLVPMATGWRQAEVPALVTSVNARVLFAVSGDDTFDLRAMHTELADRMPSDLVVRYFRDSDRALETEIAATPPLGPEQAAALRGDPDGPGHIMVSSGTTGIPKASVFGNNDLILMLVGHTAAAMELTADDLAVGIAPAGLGSTGYIFPILAPLLVGASSVVAETWSPRAALDLIVAEGATFATAIPTQMVMLLELPLEDYALERFTRFNNAGAPLPAAAAEQIEKRMGCRVQTIYGATDGGVPVMTAIADPDHPRRTSVGRVLPGEEVELRDALGTPVGDGEAGEVCWRGANKSFGHLNQPDYDAAAFDEAGWFRSGDLGRFDGDGYLRIVGRAKDMILRGGVNIFPFEIEDALSHHPAVASVAVVGVPDERLGERTCAVVVATGAAAPTLSDLVAHLTDSGLARFKHPEFLVVVDDMPTNQGGKVDRALVRRVAVDRVG